MRLVEHVGGREARRSAGIGIDQLVEHQEQLERVDGAAVEIVVAIFAVVEMEAAQPAELDQPRHDHLDVDGRRMVAEIDQAEGLRAEAGGGEIARAPVLDDGGVEGGLVDLVLDEQPPIRRQAGIDRARGIQVALEAGGEMLLAGEVGAIADPDRERLRAQRPADLDAFQIVLDRLAAGRGIGVAEAAELVGTALARLILEGVGVHGIEAQAQGSPLRAQGGEIGHLVPGDVQGDPGRRPGQGLDDGAIGQLVEHVARLAGPGEAGEAGAAGAHTPGRDRHREGRDLVGQRRQIEAAPGQPLAERRVVRGQLALALGIVLLDRGADGLVHEAPSPSAPGQRVNDWALPASTFRMLPVDLAASSETRKQVAAATSSGSTLRFKRLRWR